MLDQNVKDKYDRWLEKVHDTDLLLELKGMNEKEINEAFYRELKFGTAGLRGILGAGTNRMNIYTVARATQGLANYINENFKRKDRKVAISRDSRLLSDSFADITARVLAANGIHVYFWPYITPVPVLSYTVRYFKCCAGVMVTASHNPSIYNGYKVYDSTGCQLTTEGAEKVYGHLLATDIFDDVKMMELDDAFDKGLIEYVEPRVMTDFIETIKKLSVLGDEENKKTFRIVYSPLHGAGLAPVCRILKETGYTKIILVKEQQFPDGYFTTCPYPNPEIREAMDLGIHYAKENKADLLVATDPDSDRVGIAVKDGADYRLMSGDETGVLLFNYICERLSVMGKMPKNPIAIKTVVSTDKIFKIAEDYGVKVINVLTGFKYIGEQMNLLEQQGREKDYIFGYEESYGYLTGPHVRDKDAVNGAFLLCEMFAYYKSRGITLIQKLEELDDKYGYFLNTTYPYAFEGQAGQKKMQDIMDGLRHRLETGEFKCHHYLDYLPGLDGLPSSDVLKIYLDEDTFFICRPSGTEPKIKFYISVRAKNHLHAYNKEQEILKNIVKPLVK